MKRTLHSFLFLSCLLSLAACSDDEERVGDDCDGHGQLVEGTCECDASYEPSEDGLSCLPVEGEPNCGEHGHAEAGACQCHEGYVASSDGLSCVPEEEMPNELDCGEHGTADGNTCTCDAGYRPTADGQGCEEDTEEPVEPGEVDLSSAEVAAAFGNDGEGNAWFVDAFLETSGLGIELYESFGGPAAPGTYEITESETSYETCGICVRYFEECGEEECARTFMPQIGGTLTLSALDAMAGGRIAGELDIVLQEVTIDESFETSVVEGGATHTLAWSFDETLEAEATEE